VELSHFSNVSQVVGDVDQLGVELSGHVGQPHLALPENHLHACNTARHHLKLNSTTGAANLAHRLIARCCHLANLMFKNICLSILTLP